MKRTFLARLAYGAMVGGPFALFNGLLLASDTSWIVFAFGAAGVLMTTFAFVYLATTIEKLAAAGTKAT